MWKKRITRCLVGWGCRGVTNAAHGEKPMGGVLM